MPDCNHLSAALRRVSPVRERIHQVVLATDRDFEALADLRVENWIP